MVTIGFFDLDKWWKIWVYRIGFIGNCLSLLGLILIGVNANLHWGEDFIKRKHNPKFNGKIEKFFYFFGYAMIIGFIFEIIEIIFDIL